MTRKSYSTDLTDAEWDLFQPYMPINQVLGRNRSVDLHEILNAICYLIRTVCQWRMLPHGFPAWPTVFLLASPFCHLIKRALLPFGSSRIDFAARVSPSGALVLVNRIYKRENISYVKNK